MMTGIPLCQAGEMCKFVNQIEVDSLKLRHLSGKTMSRIALTPKVVARQSGAEIKT